MSEEDSADPVCPVWTETVASRSPAHVSVILSTPPSPIDTAGSSCRLYLARAAGRAAACRTLPSPQVLAHKGVFPAYGATRRRCSPAQGAGYLV